MDAKLNITTFICLILLFAGSVFAEAKKIKRLDGSSISMAEVEENINRLMKAAKVTGLNIAIFNDSKIAYLKSFGFRDTEKNLPMDETTVIYGASLTKVFSATS